ncbi:MAG: hypothetical protein NTY48_00560 [Candidatus Diapherotrites archaeon]|nr:hypothetical protein [Candidatus Diapherotrites archaeon]
MVNESVLSSADLQQGTAINTKPNQTSSSQQISSQSNSSSLEVQSLSQSSSSSAQQVASKPRSRLLPLSSGRGMLT